MYDLLTSSHLDAYLSSHYAVLGEAWHFLIIGGGSKKVLYSLLTYMHHILISRAFNDLIIRSNILSSNPWIS